MMSSSPPRVRRLAPADLDAVVAIDAASTGRPRRAYFERRLRAALAVPAEHVQVAVDDGDLAGYLLARHVSGEFGRDEPSLRLEVIGIRRDVRGRGQARAMLDEASCWAVARGAPLVRTQASWRDHELLRFFARAGFELSRNPVIDCDVAAAGGSFEGEEPTEAPPTREIAYSEAPPEGGLARDRVEVRILTRDDATAVARIDRLLTRRDRALYLTAAVREALEDSAVRVSLVALVDGAVAGYAMARTDYGDFGRLEPVAVLDAVGVDPRFGRRGVGRALLSQLFLNLGALRVERCETVAGRDNFDLLAFLYRAGFGASAALALQRPTAR